MISELVTFILFLGGDTEAHLPAPPLCQYLSPGLQQNN